MSLPIQLLIAYLLGAVPTSVLVGRWARGIDVREHGSGNAGATNTWRVLGWKFGVSVLIIDMLKGVAAATLAPRILISLGLTSLDPGTVAVLCGMAAVLGHVFPVYLRFRGGKGVATAAGMLIATAPIPVGIAVGVFAVVLLTTGRVSVGSILGGWTVPIATLLLHRPDGSAHPPLLIGLTFALACFILYTHRANVRRLVRGEEKGFAKLQLWRYIIRR